MALAMQMILLANQKCFYYKTVASIVHNCYRLDNNLLQDSPKDSLL